MIGGGAALSALAGALLTPETGAFPLLWLMFATSVLGVTSILMVVRREKYIEYGGPDGGNGGKGGDIVFEAVQGLNTLIDFRYAQHFKAKRGNHGQGKDKTGAGADDLVIKVPVGTQILSEDKEEVLADFTEVGQRIVFLEGGLGGRGRGLCAAGGRAGSWARRRAPRFLRRAPQLPGHGVGPRGGGRRAGCFGGFGERLLGGAHALPGRAGESSRSLRGLRLCH